MVKPSRLKVVAAILVTLIQCTLFTSPLSAAITFPHQFLPSPNYAQADVKALLKISSPDSGALPRTDVTWLDPQGKTVSCHPVGGGGCTIDNGYSAIGTLISATHEFYILGQHRVPGTYTAVARYCYPDPWTHTCTGWTETFRTLPVKFLYKKQGNQPADGGRASAGITCNSRNCSTVLAT